jgi:hypothetical protein
MLSGKWRNERGSEMLLRLEGLNISGTYTTRIGDDRAKDIDVPLVGLASGELVGFVVCWPEASSLTSWAGRLVRDEGPDGETWSLHTVWHFARQELPGDPPRTTQVWDTFLTNSSVFRKIRDKTVIP